jgi:excisionase family DNA binding protein
VGKPSEQSKRHLAAIRERLKGTSAMRPSSNDLLTIEEAAGVLGLSKVTLRRWTKQEQLPFVRINGRGDRRFRRGDLEHFIQAHATASESAFARDEVRED